jgi:hypothetical protein
MSRYGYSLLIMITSDYPATALTIAAEAVYQPVLRRTGVDWARRCRTERCGLTGPASERDRVRPHRPAQKLRVQSQRFKATGERVTMMASDAG